VQPFFLTLVFLRRVLLFYFFSRAYTVKRLSFTVASFPPVSSSLGLSVTFFFSCVHFFLLSSLQCPTVSCPTFGTSHTLNYTSRPQMIAGLIKAKFSPQFNLPLMLLDQSKPMVAPDFSSLIARSRLPFVCTTGFRISLGLVVSYHPHSAVGVSNHLCSPFFDSTKLLSDGNLLPLIASALSPPPDRHTFLIGIIQSSLSGFVPNHFHPSQSKESFDFFLFQTTLVPCVTPNLVSPLQYTRCPESGTFSVR